MGGRKQRNLGSIANLATEQTKYDLGSQEQRGYFTMGASSMGRPLQSLNTNMPTLIANTNPTSPPSVINLNFTCCQVILHFCHELTFENIFHKLSCCKD